MFINDDRKISFGLIRDCLFTGWRLGFVFDPQLHELQLLSLWRADTTIFAELNKHPPPPPSLLSPLNVFEIHKPPGVNRGFTVNEDSLEQFTNSVFYL